MRAGKLYIVMCLLATTPTHVTSPTVDKPKPVLTREPAGEIFEGDKVTLSCVVRGGSGGWRYRWYKGSQHSTPVYQTDSSSKTGAGYTISAAALNHSGEYWCRAERGRNPFNSDYSSAVNIEVSELFSTSTLTVLPDASVWEGEPVTLQCGAHINKHDTQLQYRYIKDNVNLSGARSRDPYSIPAAELKDTGSYQCEVEAAGMGVKKRSDSVWLFVKELFRKPTLTFTPVSPEWEGEAVTLQCGVQINKQGTQLQYRYIKDNGNLIGAGSQDQHSIPAAGLRDTGSYQCEVEAAGTGLNKRSDSVRLSLKDGQPKPVLTREPAGEILEGDTVTLSCVVEGGSDGWRYLWHKGMLSDLLSSFVSTERPQAVLTQEPAWTQIYETERVTLRCQVQGGYTDWRFTWYKDGRNDLVTQDYYSRIAGDSYTISSAAQYHSGKYTCKGVRTGNPSFSTISDALTLRVSAGKPKPVLTQKPAGEILEGDTVTLSCSVQPYSSGWRYLWYKGSQYSTPVYQTDSSSGTGVGYTISAAALSQSTGGEYRCLAGRGSKPFNSDYSNAVKIKVSELFSTPTLTVRPHASVWEGEAVTLQCGAQIYKQGTQLQYRYITVNGDLSGAGSQDQYSIPAAELRDRGSYQCEVEAAGTGVKKRSDSVWLSVSELFRKPTLTFTPVSPVWEGEAVTLQCGVQIDKWGTRLQYRYIKDNGDLRGAGSQDQHSIPAAELRDTGSYQCEVEAAGTGLKKRSDSVRLSLKELPQPTITLEPPFLEICTGETVTLRCGVEVGSAGWKYLWYKDSEDTPVLQTAGRSITGDSYTITAAAVSDQGQYCCRGQRGDQPLYSQLSDKVILTVSEVRPKAVLTLHPAWTQIFTGETVTLSCEVEGGSAGWRFKQYRDGHEEVWCNDQYNRRDGDSCTISTAQYNHSGVYWCESGQERSNAVNLTMSKLPQPTITLEPPFPEIFTGETVTLRCGVEGGSAGWKYLWYKDSEDTPVLQTAGRSITGDSYTITAAAVSDQGQYWCRGQRGDQPLYSHLSDKVILTVSELFSTPTLTVLPGASAWEGETVTLQCGSQIYKHGTQLQYRYIKDNWNVRGAGSQDHRSIPAAEPRDTGSYQCEVEAAGTGLKKRSDSVWLSVRELFTSPALTVMPDASVWEGETVTLQCGAQINKRGTQLKYRYSKDNGDLSGAGSRDPYSIPAAVPRDTGSYQCEVEAAGMGVKKMSDSVSLTVRELFRKPTLTFTPASPVWKGEAVTLQCGAQIYKQGTQLQYRYIKDNGDLSGARSRDPYSIPAAELRDTGSYQCEVEAAGTGMKKRSDSVRLSMKELPQTTLTLEPLFPEICTGETVTLRCGVKGGSAGWKYLWYKDNEDTPVLQTAGRSITGASYTITAAAVSDQGQYWCRGQRGDQPLYSQLSDKVILTVSDQWVILQTPLQPVIEGDSLTLRCRVRTNYTFTRIVFFKDNEEIQSQNNTELSVDRVSKSDEGSYKCRAMWNSSTYSGDSAEVRVSVRELFSRVTLTASPGATVKEGEALNLTCEAAVNKTPRPQLHYTIVRDGVPVTNSTNSALYSIASSEKSHTGSYTCAVESQGVRKSSQELHIEVQTSWHSAVAIGYRVSFTLIHFIVFTLLLLQYCRIQGSLCIAGGTSRKTSDQDQEQSAERIELCSRVQHTGVELQ
ncbi:Fc receptor-like protein 5 [Acipenser ruthenus]|uniref:Fc receptor-like protein 5 n=1 Tax=Acipenser ruthenus TaxID=7906 RepID=UPI002740B761|nr:Fc receptor-like protein 5 [Acipenser ruthenus]